MPYNLPNKYSNIFWCHIFIEWISEYIWTREMAQIGILKIFEGHITQLFKYSYSSLIAVKLEKAHSCCPLNKKNHWIFIWCIIRPKFTLLIKNRQANSRIRFGANVLIYSDKLFFWTYIRTYSVVQKSTNKYPNILVLGKWHKYNYK